jgi:nucleotide-binding universal stress UspA family protein
MLHFTNEPFPEYAPGTSSEKRFLVGIDAPLSAETRYALQTISDFAAAGAKQTHLLLLNVIPVPYIGGRHTLGGSFSPTPEERKQAGVALRTACALLQEYGLLRSQIEACIRIGSPAEELVSVAKERRVDCLAIGRRRPPPALGLRRLLMGNISQDVQHKAPCPILVVTLPQATRPGSPVSWYVVALKQALHDHPGALLNLTAADVMARFPPPHQLISARQERRAAVQALEHLADSGMLCRQQVRGEMHYLND